MAEQEPDTSDRVGPVLQAGAVADAIIAAITQLNTGVVILDRGAYRRVLVPRRCVVTRAAVEEHLGRAVHFPGDLEKVMPAFKGLFAVSEESAAWVFPGAESGHQERH
jgi:hypothetical protein